MKHYQIEVTNTIYGIPLRQPQQAKITHLSIYHV